MKNIIVAAVLLPALAAAQAIINTPPAIVQCQPVALTYSGGTAPYFISIIPGGSPGAAAIKTFPTQQSAGSYTWEKVDIPAGTSISFQIRDGSGQLNYSDPVSIQGSDDTTCLGAAASSVSSLSSSASSASSVSSSASSVASSISSSASSAIASIRSSASSVASSAASAASSVASSVAAGASSAASSVAAAPSTAAAGTGAATKDAKAQIVLGAVVAAVAVVFA